MKTEEIKLTIYKGSREIKILRNNINETFLKRNKSPKYHKDWKDACSEFHSRYDELSFPGGSYNAISRIRSNEPLAIEAALCFIEIRPYFFRSGYMYRAFIPKLKQANLSPIQKIRFDCFMTCYKKWRENEIHNENAYTRKKL